MNQEEYLFYDTGTTYEAATSIYPYIKAYLEDVRSVLDIGCGIGGWAKAFEDQGISNLTLIDHPSIDPNKLLISNKACFNACDLDKELPPPISVDLVVCTEVLEHFNAERGIDILKYISTTSDLILFSAAVPNQGGCGHLNERRHLYWHKCFGDLGYKYFDGFKKDILSLSQINYWLRQNLFFYYKPCKAYLFKGVDNITTDEFELVSSYILSKELGPAQLFKMLPAALAKSILNRIQQWRKS